MAENKEKPAEQVTDADRQRAASEAAVEAEKHQIDETIPGGRYIIGADPQGRGGTEVDCNGKPLSEKK